MLLENVVLNEVINGEITSQFLVKSILQDELDKEISTADHLGLGHSDLRNRLVEKGYTIKEVASSTYYITR